MYIGDHLVSSVQHTAPKRNELHRHNILVSQKLNYVQEKLKEDQYSCLGAVLL